MPWNSTIKWKPHWKKLKNKKPINRESKRRRAERKIRNSQHEQFVKDHPRCEIRSRVCTGWTQCRHHLKGRVGTRFLDTKWQRASCFACNLFVDTAEGDIWARANGHKLDRIGKEENL